MTEATDTLDRMANPHPRMWREAEAAYRRRWWSPFHYVGWRYFLRAMCAATGYERSYFLDKLSGRG